MPIENKGYAEIYTLTISPPAYSCARVPHLALIVRADSKDTTETIRQPYDEISESDWLLCKSFL
jgi:hypothetical protein